MPPTAYPMPSAGGPQYESFTEEEPVRAVTRGPVFADFGQDTFSPGATAKVRYFVINYRCLTAAEAATLDAHADSAYEHLGFNLTTPTGEVIGNVKYLERQRSHTKVWSQTRTVRLEKRP